MRIKIQQVGIYETLVAQLDRIFRHNRQGSFHTKRRYYEAMKRFCAYLADVYHLQKLSNISGKHLVSYVIYLQDTGKSASTIKTDLAAIRFFHDKMDHKYTLPSNDELGVTLERRRFGQDDRTWSMTEFNKMLGKALAIDRYDFILALYLARYVGLRIHECFRIDTATRSGRSGRTPSPSRARVAKCGLSPSMSRSPLPCGSSWSAHHGGISCWCPMICLRIGPSTTCNSSL